LPLISRVPWFCLCTSKYQPQGKSPPTQVPSRRFWGEHLHSLWGLCSDSVIRTAGKVSQAPLSQPPYPPSFTTVLPADPSQYEARGEISLPAWVARQVPLLPRPGQPTDSPRATCRHALLRLHGRACFTLKSPSSRVFCIFQCVSHPTSLFGPFSFAPCPFWVKPSGVCGLSRLFVYQHPLPLPGPRWLSCPRRCIIN